MLHTFSVLLVEREKNKEGMTLSYLKTVAYQVETLLKQETPLEILIIQLEDAKRQHLDTQTLEKQIDKRISALSSRYQLIRNLNAENEPTLPVYNNHQLRDNRMQTIIQ